MAKKFVLYVNDSTIKVYHATNKIFSFYNQYNIDDSESVNGLLSLLTKYNAWNINIFLETSEVMIDKKIFDKKHFKDIKAILYNYTHKPDLLLSCALPNDQKGNSFKNKTTARIKEYGMFSIVNSTYHNLKNLLNTISNNQNKIKIINYLPICLGISKIVQNEENTINVVVKIRKNHTYTIDVFYGHSFIIHRDNTLDSKTNIKQEIMSTISYIETIVTGQNLIFATTIFTEIVLPRDQVSAIKSDRIDIVNGNDIFSKFGSKIKLGKNSDSEIDDNILAVIISNKCYHTNFVNEKLNKKELFFKFLPISYICIALLFFGLLASELNNIFVEMPKTLHKIAMAEKEFNIVQEKLNKLKKIAVDPDTLSYIQACSKLENIDIKKANYINIILDLNSIVKKYEASIVFTDYSFICTKDCHDSTIALYSLKANGTMFNQAGHYEGLIALGKAFSNDLQIKFSNFKVVLPDYQISPKIGTIYDKFSFNIMISSNAS